NLVNPHLIDLVDTLSVEQRYSYSFDGNAQTLDHIIVNQPALALLNRFAYARADADYAVKNYESSNQLRLSDHDQPIAYFSLAAPTVSSGVMSGRLTQTNGAAIEGAVINLEGSQTRKTITDVDGRFRFESVQVGGFYSITPARGNYVFSPAS